MATFYSNHYGPAVGATGHFTTRSTERRIVSAGYRHGRLRHSHAIATVPAAQDLGDNDVIMVLGMKSSDRLGEIRFSMDADWGATTAFNIGLYKLGGDGDLGDVIDEDLFASAVDWSGAIARVEYFKEATTLTDMDRWKTLWELAAIGAASYTVDPVEDWVVALTTTQDISATAAAVSLMGEVIYKSGD